MSIDNHITLVGDGQGEGGGLIKIRLRLSHSATFVIEVWLRAVATATFVGSNVFKPPTRQHHRAWGVNPT